MFWDWFLYEDNKESFQHVCRLSMLIPILKSESTYKMAKKSKHGESGPWEKQYFHFEKYRPSIIFIKKTW